MEFLTPKVSVKSLKPQFVRQRHIGPVRSRETKAQIETTAALMRIAARRSLDNQGAK